MSSGNPESLDKLQLEKTRDGKTTLRAALHKDWAEKREWMCFIPPTRLPLSETGAKDRWISAAFELSQDFHWLLSLSHNCFWSQLVFDPGARSVLLSYLEKSPRCYDKELAAMDQDQKKIVLQLHSLVFKIYMRIMTPKETNVCFMSQECHGRLLYDNYLLDVPTMLDLCLLYGHGSTKSALTKCFSYIVEVQPAFLGDLSSAAQMLSKALKDLETYFVTEDGAAGAMSVPLSHQAPASKGDISPEQLEDLVLFLVDIVTSVSSLLDLLPACIPTLHSANVEPDIARFYELVVPEMYKTVMTVPENAQCGDLMQKMDTARYYLLTIAKATLGTRVASVVEIQDKNEAGDNADEYLRVLAECLAEPRFIRDYHMLCPIDQDLDILRQKCPDQLDPAKYDFLLESVFSCFDVPKRSEQRVLAETRQVAKVDPNPGPSGLVNGHIPDEVDAEALVLQSLISEIQAILPDLGAGFVKKCLLHYNHNKENVVNAILEESLPKELQELDRTIPLPCGPAKDEAGPSVSVRLNVFDHDEFDVMSRDHIDTSRVHKGKWRSKHKNLTDLLNDKEDLRDIRESYTRYGSVQDVVYDDEYDDTYDDVDVSLPDTETFAERRPFVTPRVLETRQEREEEEVEEVESYENPSRAPRDFEAFAQDPALLRAQAEQRRASKMPQHQQHRPPARDVVGKPKGQGQDTNVLINRQKKNTNKSSGANHNRRAGAQRKMRQGMIPS